MSVLTVRNLDDATREALKAMAAAHGRSMEGEARVILTAAVSPTAATATGLGSRIAELFADVDWPGSERTTDVARAAPVLERPSE